VLKAGFVLAGGQLDRSAQAPVAKPLSAAAHRVVELMNHLALDRDTALVADSVRADVALSYRLLRYANSPAIGLVKAVDSVEQAVMLLGRQELQRWLSVALLSAATGRKASKALEELALARGRLMEALGRLAGEPAPQNLFMLGLLSMLEVLMQLPLATVLAPLRLSESANQALLHQSGPWAPYLRVASALESGDDQRLAPLAQAWGGVEAVHAANDEAWAWAIEVSDSTAAATAPAG
jgi:c-di-GMP phosphodiesterase